MRLGTALVISVLGVSLCSCRVLKSLASDDEAENEAAAAASAAALEVQKKLEAAKAAAASAQKAAAAPKEPAEPKAPAADAPTVADFEEEAFETITPQNYEQKLAELEKEVEGAQ
jgi:hypothetical protein